MSLAESLNPLYPNGQCDVCGWGLTEEFLCQNTDCQQYGLPGCHIDCGPIVARDREHHAHESSDGICWHWDTPDACIWDEDGQCAICLECEPLPF